MSAQAGIRALAAALPDRCRPAAPLAECCTWRIGGAAELLVQPADARELALALAICAENATPWRLIGGGSNLLFPDEGLPGATIRLGGVFAEIAVEGRLVRAGAAAPAGSLCRRAAEAGLSGLEYAVGIPAWLGGMLRMNAGAHGGETAAIVRRVRVLEPGLGERWIDGPEMGFGYRDCTALAAAIALEAELELVESDAEKVRAATRENNDYRRRTQPLSEATCGSVFRRPPGDFPGRLIEAAGCKGRRVGAIRVSERHANFFVNEGRGRACDALELVAEVKHEVKTRFGVELVEEFAHVR